MFSLVCRRKDEHLDAFGDRLTNGVVTMSPLNDLIGSRKLDVCCRLCGWTGTRALDWLSVQRDMNCPACTSVIVLNTSEFKRAIASLRRQVSMLHQQLAAVIPAEGCTGGHAPRPLRTPSAQANGELALLRVYRQSGCTMIGKPPSPRRARGVYR